MNANGQISGVVLNLKAYITPFMLSNVHQLEYLEPEVTELYEAAWDSLNIYEIEGYRPSPIIDFTRDAVER
ncbi:MAG: hypothetical protein WD355_10400 [Balneolaceae bacterium]